jgi:hypothetical protein
MSDPLTIALAVAAVGAVVARALRGRGVRVSDRERREAWRSFAAAHELRFSEGTGWGFAAQGSVSGVEFVIFAAQLQLGWSTFCATAMAHEPSGNLLVNHRAFPLPSVAKRGMPSLPLDDPEFEQRFEARANDAKSAKVQLGAIVRQALLQLPPCELSLLDSRVSVVWPMTTTVPKDAHYEAARTLLAELAARRVVAKYR